MKTAESIKVEDDGFEDTAAFITADGVPVLITYNKKCLVDTEELDKSISSCVAGLYDINGTGNPNKYGFTLNDDGETIKAFTHDIRAFNGAAIGEQKLFSFTIVSKFQDFDDAWDRSGTRTCTNNIWECADLCELSGGSPEFCTEQCGGSMQQCHELVLQYVQDYCTDKGGSLPTKTQLIEIARALYNDKTIADDSTSKSYQNWNNNPNVDAVFEMLGSDTFYSVPYTGMTIVGGGIYTFNAGSYGFRTASQTIIDDTLSVICVK